MRWRGNNANSDRPGFKIGNESYAIGVAQVTSSEVQIEDCLVEAVVPIWGTMLTGLAVERSTLAGLFGMVVQNSSEVRVLNSKVATLLDAIVSGGLAWTWHIVDNVIFGRVGLLFSTETVHRVGSIDSVKHH